MDIELREQLSKYQPVKGTELYAELVRNNGLCSLSSWKRILNETQDINNDFHTLRTYVQPVMDTIGVLHFISYPADGAMADEPLVGRILVPKDYPQSPPIVHLFTSTKRFNVDIYRTYIDNLFYLHSSMCFDVLTSKSQGGIWEAEFTLSTLIASLIQSIVSLNVPQQYGGDTKEFVTMETLNDIHSSVRDTYRTYKDIMPPAQPIMKIISTPITNTQFFNFPRLIKSNMNSTDLIISSNPIRLQTKEQTHNNVHSIGFDLSNLSNNPFTVFSLVLANSRRDMVGKQKNTILVRNGVTATAAKKIVNGETQWFYHGLPMNQKQLKLVVTIGFDQFCITYFDEKNKVIPLVHGDLPVSCLTSAEIGPVNNQPFYLNVFMKNKRGAPVTISTFQPTTGFLHPCVLNHPFWQVNNPISSSLMLKETIPSVIPQKNGTPIYVMLKLNPETTHNLQMEIKTILYENGVPNSKKEYPVQRGLDDPSHITLAFHSDFKDKKTYEEFIQENYRSKLGSQFRFSVGRIFVDFNCVGCEVTISDNNVNFYPPNKLLHITMMLYKSPPVYTNQLIERLSKPGYVLKKGEYIFPIRQLNGSATLDFASASLPNHVK